MGRCTVEYKGKYASFSSISDSFVTELIMSHGDCWNMVNTLDR